MSNEQGARQGPPLEPQYISGWFTKQFEAGVKPDYGYPKNHLPETNSEPMEMVTGFIACFKDSVA